MANAEERLRAYLLKHKTADATELALNCDVREADAQRYLDIRSTRNHHVGESDYSQHKIQPWDIWLEYNLNPWDADIVKRVLRKKPGQRRLDYEKIKHVCDERIRQLDAGTYEDTTNVNLERKESPTT